MKSLLRQYYEMGYKVELLSEKGKPHISILTNDKLSDQMLMDVSPILSVQIWQIADSDTVTHEEIASFFNSGKKLVEEMSADELHVKYNKKGFN